MTPQEFRAWFEGFTECLSGTPNREQWDRIKARVKEIDGFTITYPIYVNKYVPQPYPYWNTLYTGVSSSNLQCTYTGGASSLSNAIICVSDSYTTQYSVNNDFNSITAMYSLGQAESR